jgi:sugar transferase (PEP-CTERM/EpsH1 system associated)
MLVSRFPYPLEKGDKLRAYYQLQEFSAHYDVCLVAISDKAITETQRAAVAPYCAEMHIVRIHLWSKLLHLSLAFFHKRPFQTAYFYSWRGQWKIRKILRQNHFDHIYCQLIRVTEYVRNEHRIPKTLDYMDALSAGIQRRITQQAAYKRWLFRVEARRLLLYERQIFDYFEHHAIISAQDRELIQHPDQKRIHIIPNGIHDAFFERQEREKTHDFVFVGNMSYPPNVEAVKYLAQHILQAFPSSRLLVSGASPDRQILSLAASNAQIEVSGWVEDIRSSYLSGRYFVAPMMIGTGMQNKLLEAMALGLPCITTPLANNAIQAKHGEEIWVASSPEAFIEAIRALQAEPALSEKLARQGSVFVRRQYSWKKSVEELIGIMQTGTRKQGK